MQPQAVWQIPDPDYERHPAYGGLFGRPRAVDRLKALARVLPHVGAYAAYDLLSRLRARDPRLIAVVITGWSQHEYSSETLPGAAAVITKPFTSAQITELVGELIGARAV